MKSLKKSLNQIQGNVLAKSNKLTIEVPDDDLDVASSKFNKNSPTFSKQNIENIKTPIPVSPSKKPIPRSSRLLKKTPITLNSPKDSKQFKFSLTPKALKRTPIKIENITNRSKGYTPPTKHSTTPVQRYNIEDTKKRPRTSAAENSIKTEGKPKTAISELVTQVRQNKKEYKSKNQIDKGEILYKEHLFQTFQALKFIRTLGPVNIDELKEKRVYVPRRRGFEYKKTLVFDLDETLVHCCEDIFSCDPTVVLPVTFPTGETVEAGINVRPYALECLKAVSKDFEVFVFTASHPCYANVVLDYLDPKKEYIHQRFFRDSCIYMNGMYIKDLRILANRNLKDVIIVDNAAYSFAYQLDNGIPIISWHDDPNDKELFNLIDYVKVLADVDDIREVNEKTFHLRTFYEDYMNEILAEKLRSP